MFSRAVRNNRRAAQIFSVEGQTALSAPAHAYFVFRVPETAVHAESVPIIGNARDQLEPVILRPDAEQILADGEPVPGSGTGEPALFAFVVLTAALSCSNSGLYGTSRAMYSLATLGMAPKKLAELNKNGMPKNAVLVSIVSCWFIILLYSFDASEAVYTYLLALSGFTGAIAWISICWSQYRFRKQSVADGSFASLKYKTPFFPYVTLFGIWAQVFCLVVPSS